VIRIFLDDPYDLGGQFFLWEYATAVAGHVLAINPFDQPDVEATKKFTKAAVSRYQETGRLGEENPAVVTPGIAVYTSLQALSLREVMIAFLSAARQDSYVGIHAYLPRTPQIHDALQSLRLKVRDSYSVATTLGYGPVSSTPPASSTKATPAEGCSSSSPARARPISPSPMDPYRAPRP
jgi:transaldolase/glucose-6-phosphate isomerase